MISIVITAYNVAPFIEECINSCINQSYKDIEIIVVLDKPTDGTEKIVRSLAKKDKRIQIVANDENMGAGMSRRIGINSAAGEYVLLLDGDDYLSTDFIEDLAARAAETDADIVSGGVTVFEPDSGRFKAETFGLKVSTGMQKFDDYNDGQIVFLANKLVRRRLYEAALIAAAVTVRTLPSSFRSCTFATWWHTATMQGTTIVSTPHRSATRRIRSVRISTRASVPWTVSASLWTRSRNTEISCRPHSFCSMFLHSKRSLHSRFLRPWRRQSSPCCSSMRCISSTWILTLFLRQASRSSPHIHHHTN